MKLESREKFQEYFDLLVTNNLFPEITLPTRFSKNNATLIDQIFCKLSKHEYRNISGILLKKISDHLPCFTALNINNMRVMKPKFVNIIDKGSQAMENFRTEITNELNKKNFDMNLMTSPNVNYQVLEDTIKSAHKKCFPIKEVKFNKYKHKIAPWITNGILRSMKFRDKLYVKWKKCDPFCFSTLTLNIDGINT